MTRKIFVFLFGVVISLMLISQAYAELKKFDRVSVNIPNGWSADQNEKTVILKSNKAEASIEISLAEIDNDSELSDIVEKLYIERDGVDLEQDDEGDYSFSFKNSSGSESIALITGTDDYYLLVSMTGFENESIQPDLETILESIDWDNK